MLGLLLALAPVVPPAERPRPAAIELQSYEVTGCASFNAGAVACNLESESIVSAHVSVLLESDGDSTELQAGGATELSIGVRTYDLIVDEANQIVCWDDGCAGDETGPFDQLQMLIVAR